jgi:hypothetical protein
VIETVAPKPAPEPLVVAKPEPVVVAKPEPVVAKPEPESVPVASRPRGASGWQPSDSLWANRVFNARSQPVPLATWPPRPKPAPVDDLRRDHIDSQVAEPARD